MKTRFKFINKESYWDHEELLEDFTFVTNPLPYQNLPDGEYMIRGSLKGHRKEYWKYEDQWYLISDVKEDNGHYYCDSRTYMLFPMLSGREWSNIEKAGWKRLNKVWQRHLWGYQNWKDMQRMIFGIKLDLYKFNKRFNEDS